MLTYEHDDDDYYDFDDYNCASCVEWVETIPVAPRGFGSSWLHVAPCSGSSWLLVAPLRLLLLLRRRLCVKPA